MLTPALEKLARELQDANPDLTIIADESGVWWRYGDREYGIYAAVHPDGPAVLVYDREKGTSAMSRPAP